MRQAKIICTLGPASCSEKSIKQLILNGMNVARLNFSHGDHNFHRTLINRIRAVSASLNKPVAILQDLQGPKLRIGKIENNHAVLKSGDETIITTEAVLGTKDRFSAKYKNLPLDVKPHDSILLDDGNIQLTVKEVKNDQEIICNIIYGGILSSNKGMNLPMADLSLPCLTEKDIKDLHFGAEAQVDAVALSFVRCGEDIVRLKQELALTKSKPFIIAKLEKPQAIQNLDDIISESDAVMVARGDLGVEVQTEKVPHIQKQIINKANNYAKPVIVATQMLESMIHNPRPTRAEASDVANAVIDGADCLMLSAETAQGNYPQTTVKIMDRIITYTEKHHINSSGKSLKIKKIDFSKQKVQNAVSLSAVSAAEKLHAKGIVIYTTSGKTASIASSYRPKSPIFVYVPTLELQRRLCFYWGIRCELIKNVANSEALLQKIDKKVLLTGVVKPGDVIVMLAKVPLTTSQRTNTIHIHIVGTIRSD